MKQEQNLPPLRMQNMGSFSDTFESSINEKQEKVTADKYITRAINENNSSIIVSQHSERTPYQTTDLNFNEQVERILLQYRLRYDQVKVQSSNLQSKIKHQKEELKRLQQEHHLLTNHKDYTDKTCKKTEQSSNLFNYELQQMILSLGQQKAMEQRLKTDILYYKKNIFDLNLELMKKKSQINRHFNQSTRQKKMSFRCRNLLHSVERTVNKNQSQRNNGLQSVEEVLSSKKQNLLKRKEREVMFERSMMEALNQKLPYQKQYLRLLYSNKLLKCMLHFKMESKMNKFQEVSHSFNIIKSNTTVKNVDEFVYKFLNKNEMYGNLLESISKLQPRISLLQEQKRNLEAENLKLQSQSQEISEIFKNRHSSKFSQAEKMDQLNTRIQNINRFRNISTNWGHSTIAMFKGIPRADIRNKYEYLGNLFGDGLRLILKYLTDEEEQEGKEKVQKSLSISQQVFQKQITKSKTPAAQLLMRNIRIKTLGDQYNSVQKDEAQYDLLSEKDFLYQARRAIKKQRFAKNK